MIYLGSKAKGKRTKRETGRDEGKEKRNKRRYVMDRIERKMMETRREEPRSTHHGDRVARLGCVLTLGREIKGMKVS